ncbi:CFI-box-CTERM domain-containing protein [Microseira wollei]|uniref:Uncharacterized protein n=1 Tax=Microseira wollei NIES-4236 TaxID=2530354 RepID=A0AAV3X8D9_9CYAN|nr:CFI-box-CTERM domain-containing protein [Microseira wollei]GET36945.1 hypothetical protein MiSe_16980 [Microseira wollei NIES-4236]
MTDFSFLDRHADQASKEVERLCERAAYYEKQQNTTQALANYIDALDAYAVFSKCEARSLKVKIPIDISLTPRETSIIYSRTLLDVANILLGIQACYTDSVTKAFLAEKVQLIFDKLSEYESSFDVQTIETYESLRKIVNRYKGHIDSNREAIEELKKRSIKELDDKRLARIRNALDEISSTEVCPLTLDSTGSCFIATAAYSTSTHPDLDTFRNFRDQKLLTNPVGKQLVSLYYQISPSIAQYVERQPTIKSLARQQLERLAQWMRNQSVKN